MRYMVNWDRTKKVWRVFEVPAGLPFPNKRPVWAGPDLSIYSPVSLIGTQRQGGWIEVLTGRLAVGAVEASIEEGST